MCKQGDLDGNLPPPVAALVTGCTRLSRDKGGYVGTIAGSLSVILLQAMLVSLNVPEGLRQVIFGTILLCLVFLFVRCLNQGLVRSGSKLPRRFRSMASRSSL